MKLVAQGLNDNVPHGKTFLKPVINRCFESNASSGNGICLKHNYIIYFLQVQLHSRVERWRSQNFLPETGQENPEGTIKPIGLFQDYIGNFLRGAAIIRGGRTPGPSLATPLTWQGVGVTCELRWCQQHLNQKL